MSNEEYLKSIKNNTSVNQLYTVDSTLERIEDVVNIDDVESSVSLFNDLQEIEDYKENIDIETENDKLEPIKTLEEKPEKKGFFKNIIDKIVEFFKSLFNKSDLSKENKATDIVEETSNPSNLPVRDESVESKLVPIREIENSKYKVNGEIDQKYKQGTLFDCLLLSSLTSLSNTEKGQKLIKDSIKINYDEKGEATSYDVYFKGLDKTYSVTASELQQADELKYKYEEGKESYHYSSGDDDMLLFELVYAKAFNDIVEEKSSSRWFKVGSDVPGPIALKSVEEEQFLYAFVGTEDINQDYDIENKYENLQVEEYAPEIMDLFEKETEFKLSDVSKAKIAGATYNGFHFDLENTYVIEQKPSETEDGSITIVKKGTDEKITTNADKLASFFVSSLTNESKIKVAEDLYDLACEADFVMLGCKSAVDIKDMSGEIKTIHGNHAYGVKEITKDSITIINPWDSTEEIVMPREEYIKYYDSFKLVSANY